MNKKVSIGVFHFFIAIMTAYLLADAPVLFAHDYDLLPTAQIIVDGNSSDWSNISPAMTDSTGDSEASQYQGTDVKTVYMAMNAARDTLYFRIDFNGVPNADDCINCGAPSDGLIKYAVAFDDPSILFFGTWTYDWQIGFDNGRFWIWDLRGQKDYDNTNNMTVYTYDQTPAAFAVGSVVEFSIPLDMMENPFKVSAYPYIVIDDGSSTVADDLDSQIQFRTFPLFANAGKDHLFDKEGERIVLDGSGSSVTGDEIVSYSWRQTSGTTVFIQDKNMAQASFAAPYIEDGGITLTFEFSVETFEGIQDQDEIVIYIYDTQADKFPDYWDEDDYLEANFDVAAVVSLNGFSSGYEHYMMYGRYEGRRGGLSIYDYPDYWDESAYLNENPDIAEAVFKHFFNNGYEHYLIYGEVEGRIARVSTQLPAYWDEAGCLSVNTDVADAVQAGWFSNGFEHYINWGRYEGRRGGLTSAYPDFWDEHGYLTTNSDVADAVSNGFFSSGYEHYMIYGETEGRRGGL